jgi:hypothetical protein
VFVSSRESDYAMFGGLRQLFFASSSQSSFIKQSPCITASINASFG